MTQHLLKKRARDTEADSFWLRPPLRLKLLKRWLRRLEAGCLTVEFPSGRRQRFGEPGAPLQASLTINDMRVVTRMIASGDIGLAEGYVAGEWDTPDLSKLLALGAANSGVLSNALDGSWAVRVLNRIRHARRANTPAGSRRNIAAHYDMGNDFYSHWLDESMTYSAAIFARPAEPLPDAQRRKYLRLARLLDLRPGDRVLEIGCGWGGFAEIAAAEFGCELVCLTLSQEQASYARERMRLAGLSENVDIRLQDYRDVAGRFDKVVSIEMFEAVGEENWQTYFAMLDRCLKPGGRVALQSITIDDRYFADYQHTPDFIQCYIFPGGMLPSPRAFAAAAFQAGFQIADAHYFGSDYAETLRRWHASFAANWPAIKTLGYDERFRRLWQYYLCYCEAGFDSGRIDVGQFLIERR